MKCIKTGAAIDILNTGRQLICDIFAVADTRVIRFYPDHWNIDAGREPTHKLYFKENDSFLREDLGILIVPTKSLTDL